MFCFFYMRLHAVVARCWRDPPFLAAARQVYFHILLFVMANILLHNSGLFSYSVICFKSNFFTNTLITFIKYLRDCDKTKQLYVAFDFTRLHAVVARLGTTMYTFFIFCYLLWQILYYIIQVCFHILLFVMANILIVL